MIDKFEGKYRFLSNFYNASVTYDGLTYLNNEAAFQAQKIFVNRERFCSLNPSEAKRLGRSVHLRSDWEQVKNQVMYDICRAKFTQNEELGKRLLKTGKVLLVEGNTWGDRIWGCVDGVGENRLGKILMRIRKELKDEKIL